METESKSVSRISKLFHSLPLWSLIFWYYSNVDRSFYLMKNWCKDSKKLWDINVKWWIDIILRNSRLKTKLRICPSDFTLKNYIRITSLYYVDLVLKSMEDLKMIIYAYNENNASIYGINSYIWEEKDLNQDIVLNLLLTNFLAKQGIYRKGSSIDISKLSNLADSCNNQGNNYLGFEIIEYITNIKYHRTLWRNVPGSRMQLQSIESEISYFETTSDYLWQKCDLSLGATLKNLVEVSLTIKFKSPEWETLLDTAAERQLQVFCAEKPRRERYFKITINNGFLFHMNDLKSLPKWYSFKKATFFIEQDKDFIFDNNEYDEDEFDYYHIKLLSEDLFICSNVFKIKLLGIKCVDLHKDDKENYKIYLWTPSLKPISQISSLFLINYNKKFNFASYWEDSIFIKYEWKIYDEWELIKYLPTPNSSKIDGLKLPLTSKVIAFKYKEEYLKIKKDLIYKFIRNHRETLKRVHISLLKTHESLIKKIWKLVNKMKFIEIFKISLQNTKELMEIIKKNLKRRYTTLKSFEKSKYSTIWFIINF